MYEVYVIANRDTQELRERFAPLSKYVRVQFVFDRSAVWPEHFPAALRRAQIDPRTDYIFVIRGEQRLHGDPRVWLTYDIEKRSVVVWPVLIEGQVVARSGLCLMPSDIEDVFAEQWVEEIEPVSETDPFPIVHYASTAPASLEVIRDLAEQMDAPYFHLIPTGMPVRLPEHPTIYPQIRSNTLPIYSQIMTVPENMRGYGYPTEFRSGTYLLPSAVADSVMSISRLLYGQGSWVRGVDNLSCTILDYPRPEYDIVMLTNGETHVEQHWAALQEKYPRARRVDGVKGVREAHIAAAELVQTDYFWVVDADNRLLPEADLDSIVIPHFDLPYLFVYRARNNVNGLSYGNGGIKLFPTRIVRGLKDVRLVGGDFTATVAERSTLCSIDLCWSETIIDGSPLEAYRAGFREGAKLSMTIRSDAKIEIIEAARSRFRSWALNRTESIGIWATRGVYDGHRMSMLADHSEISQLINDYAKIAAQFEWLQTRRTETWWNQHVEKWQKALEDETAFG